jgi:hypothetical protein
LSAESSARSDFTEANSPDSSRVTMVTFDSDLERDLPN